MKDLLKIPSIGAGEIEQLPDRVKQREDLILRTSKITRVSNKEEAEAVKSARTAIKELSKDAETIIDRYKGPFYRLYKNIMEAGSIFLAPLETEAKRLKKLDDDFAEAEYQRVQKETQRIAAEQRAAEQRAADALREQERIANLAKPSAKKEAQAEQKSVEAMTQVMEARQMAPAPMATASKAKMVLKYEITDKTALYNSRPEFFNLEEKRSVILASITKETKLLGLKVWEAIETR